MRNFIFLLLGCISLSAFSQNIRFEGNIVDNDGKPLEMANVMAVNVASKGMDAYAITNDKGKFVLNLKASTAYTIKVSYLGMASKEVSVTTTTENMTQKIQMEAGGIELNAVEIVKEMPVSISGDTISYNADSFKTGTERKLEDVLKKLPGVEVNADGEVEVEGKKVQKLMVEGKDFFDGDTKLGVKNIPADAIDKVQVLRNYNEIGQLKGLENNEENIAMNIKLKDGKKNFWFGDLTAGTGIGHEENRFLVNPKLFYYNPKFSVNLIGNFNNIGELPLTMQDYFKMTGGFRSAMRRNGTNFNVSSNDLGIAMLRNNRAKEIDTDFGAANFSYNPTKAWNISGFGIFSRSKTDMETDSQTEYIEEDIQENREDRSRQRSSFGLFKLSSSYKPSTTLQFDYDALLKTSKQDENARLLRESIVDGVANTENIFTNKEQDPISLNQNLSLYYTLNEKNIFAVEMQHLYQNEDPFYNANLATQPFNFTEYISGQLRNDINQQRFVKTNKFDLKADYYYVLTPKSNLNVSIGNTYSYQNFDSRIFQILDNEQINELDSPENRNDVSYAFNDAFVGLHYKLLFGAFTINPGFSVHTFSMANDQNDSEFKRDFIKILPDFYMMWQIRKSETLTYNYSLTNDFTDINQLAEGYVFSNYNSLFRGNRQLENATSQVHSLRYFRYNMFNFENIFGNLMYTKRTDAVKNQAFFDGVNQTNTPFNSRFADETISGMGSYGRSFLRYYKAQVSASLNWSKFNNIVLVPDVGTGELDPTRRTTESFTQNYRISASTQFRKLPNLEVGYNFTVNEFTGQTFYTDRPFAKLDYYFLDAFSLVTEYEFYHYYNKSGANTVDNEYDFLSASLIYQKKGSKWEYKVSATNLLNTTSLNDNNFDQFRITNSQYYVQPRYVILSLRYNL
ncbi:carboxypeptidase-like regulatory domain-containing protein [Flavobacterium selenitireducens]|uniref:carboxypeptidase-like regulatory domain-containing protein n=1 Tax=Flavobacterium selenitireducens TaxID=2722704 RepID=UPI00168B4329|nr:carboxypeptidase-like regulatory domain-containing protein [Flavobacterium selenitireducens]MBD3583190.1 TonB-dependent receptor [Flavobacterium selenitireducens]